MAAGRCMVRPRRRMVVCGSTAATSVAATAVRSMAAGAGRCAAALPAAVSRNDCVSAAVNRVAVGLSGPPRVGTNVAPGVLRTKLLLVGYVATLAGVWPASDSVCAAGRRRPAADAAGRAGTRRSDDDHCGGHQTGGRPDFDEEHDGEHNGEHQGYPEAATGIPLEPSWTVPGALAGPAAPAA